MGFVGEIEGSNTIPLMAGPIPIGRGLMDYFCGAETIEILAPSRNGEGLLNSLVFHPGDHRARHWHDSARVSYVWSGCCEVTIENEGPTRFSAGAMFVVPPGSKHTVNVPTGESASATLITLHPDSPIREGIMLASTRRGAA